MGISGANFAVAEAGVVGTVTNEGNLRLVTTLPRVHVILAGLEKLIPTVADALRCIQVLPRNATAQAITSYVTWIAGANECQVGPNGKKEMHIVFLDNGRTKIVKDPAFKDVPRCVRCGACTTVPIRPVPSCRTASDANPATMSAPLASTSPASSATSVPASSRTKATIPPAA